MSTSRTARSRCAPNAPPGNPRASSGSPHERPSGTFARQLTLGYGLALDRISAEYTDGVLTLTIPVAEEAKPRKIEVSHTGASTSPVIEGGEG